MSQPPEYESIMSLLGLICRAQRGQLNAGLGEIGIYAGQEVVLWELSRQDGLCQSQLVELLSRFRPSASGYLDSDPSPVGSATGLQSPYPPVGVGVERQRALAALTTIDHQIDHRPTRFLSAHRTSGRDPNRDPNSSHWAGRA